MKLEVGKYYSTRGGEKVYIDLDLGPSVLYRFSAKVPQLHDILTYSINGFCKTDRTWGIDEDWDIESEWVEKPKEEEQKSKIDREYWRYKFAGIALRALCFEQSPEKAAEYSVKYSDLLLKELEKTK